MYVLVLVDRTSRFVMFIPTNNVNTADAVRTILSWVIIFELPTCLISDGFKNDLVKQLTELVAPHYLAILSLGEWLRGSGGQGPIVDLVQHLQ